MRVIYVPGFWDSPDKFNTLSSVFEENSIEYKILDYNDYKKFGSALNKETFSEVLNDLIGEDIENSIIISYSMGASFVYDYLSGANTFSHKLIFINPLLETVQNPLVSSYYRVLDMLKQGHLVEAILTAHKGLFPLMGIALQQQNYNRKINFDKKINMNATFVWSEKDLICPFNKYEQYKLLFNESEIITVPDHHHNWLVYREPVVKYLIPQITL